MISLVVLIACIVVPLAICSLLKLVLVGEMPVEPAAMDRALGRFRRATFVVGTIAIVAAAVAGALSTDPDLLSPWPTAAAWFFSSLCMTTVWITMALCQRTPDETRAMSHWKAFGRAVQTATLGVTGTGLSLFFTVAVAPALPLPPPADALIAAALCVVGVAVLSPWIMMILGIWRVFEAPLEVNGVSWHLAHLPTPTPFLTHVAALPWLRTVLLSDGLLRRVPERHWRTLVLFEVSEAAASRLDRVRRWIVAVPLSLLVFVAAGVAGADDPKKLVAGIALAVAFTLGATWVANRQPTASFSSAHGGPSPEDLAQTLRHLPPSYGQAIPRTSHKTLGSAIYDRLFALGHDPGPRPRR